jgi:hypothetical protein
MRRRLLLAGGLAAGLAIALVVVFVLVIDSGTSDDEPAIASSTTSEADTSEPTSSSASAEPVAGSSASSEQQSPSSEGKGFDADCINSIQREYDCYEAYLVDVLNTQGAPAALVELAELADRDTFVRSECHPLTHSIGRAAMERYGSFQNAVTYEDGTCWSGFTHGILEGFMFKYTVDELDQAVQGVCVQDPEQAYSFDYYNCVHGLGHGVSWRFDNGVFEALPVCDALEGRWEQQSCHSGVFMQNIVVDGEAHQSRELREDEPMYPCTAVDEQYKKTCYLMQTSYALRTVDYDYAKGFELCETEADEGYVETCYRSMGRDISGNSHRESTKVVELCSLGDPELQKHCFQGAVKNAVFNDHGLENADELCRLVPERYTQDCVEARDLAASTL